MPPDRISSLTKNPEGSKRKDPMPPLLILALVGAVLALLAKDENELPTDQQEELKKLQSQLADARRNLRHAQNAKKRFVAATGAVPADDDKGPTISAS